MNESRNAGWVFAERISVNCMVWASRWHRFPWAMCRRQAERKDQKRRAQNGSIKWCAMFVCMILLEIPVCE